MKVFFSFKKNILITLLLLIAFLLIFLLKYFDFDIKKFSANILQEQSIVFDGTALPLKDKFFYTTMYLGSYDQLGVENVGNHAGVDLAAKRGTPIYAIANGVVVISRFGNFGEGYYVVIKHENVPSLEDANIKTTYYSSYLHMEAMPIVNEGQIVKKGQLIGYVGSSGNSTGPHLHLQIDKIISPFNPYWNYDSQKVSFYTINPLMWINKYKNYDSNNNNFKDVKNEDIYKDNQGKNVLVKNKNDLSSIYNQKTSSFLINGSNYALKGNAINLQIQAISFDGSIDKDYKPKSNIKLISNDNDIIFMPSILKDTDFKEGVANIAVLSNKSGEFKIEIDDGVAYAYKNLYFIDDVKYANKYKLESTKSTIYIGQSIDIKVSVLDDKNNLVPNYKMVSKNAVLSVLPADAGYFLPDILQQKDFEFGKSYFKFIATKAYEKVTIKIQEGVLVGFLNITIKESKNPFIDVDSSNKYYDAISYLKFRGIIQGYSDGTFRPDNPVSRAEMLKIILLGFKIPISSDFVASFNDIRYTDWYTPYIYTAKKMGIISGYEDGNFYPNKTINKVEAFKIILLAKKVDLPKVDKNIAADVRYTDWYAPYVKFMIDNKIIEIPKDNLIKPGELITRGMMADIIYKIEKKLN